MIETERTQLYVPDIKSRNILGTPKQSSLQDELNQINHTDQIQQSIQEQKECTSTNMRDNGTVSTDETCPSTPLFHLYPDIN
jgi:hypothetical protein